MSRFRQPISGAQRPAFCRSMSRPPTPRRGSGRRPAGPERRYDKFSEFASAYVHRRDAFTDGQDAAGFRNGGIGRAARTSEVGHRQQADGENAEGKRSQITGVSRGAGERPGNSHHLAKRHLCRVALKLHAKCRQPKWGGRLVPLVGRPAFFREWDSLSGEKLLVLLSNISIVRPCFSTFTLLVKFGKSTQTDHIAIGAFYEELQRGRRSRKNPSAEISASCVRLNVRGGTCLTWG